MWWRYYISTWINHNCSLIITPVSEIYRSDYQIWFCLTVFIYVRIPKEASKIAMVDFKVLKFERTITMVNWQLYTVITRQLRSYTASYDHASLFVSCSYDHCSGAVTIILPENKTTILQISHGYFVFSLVTNDDKWQIYIECKLCVSTWHARVTIGPCPNPPSPTSAILYDRNCYDRNCFPTVITWTNVDWSSVKSSDIHIRAISQEIPQSPSTKISLKFVKFH